MKQKNPVLRETAVVALGECIGVAILVGLFALAGHFSMRVVWSALLGGVLSVLNFLFMGVAVSNAADKAEAGDPAGGQKSIQLSFLIRILLLGGILVAAGLSKLFNPLALVLPLIFVRLTLTIAEFFRKAGDSNGT